MIVVLPRRVGAQQHSRRSRVGRAGRHSAGPGSPNVWRVTQPGWVNPGGSRLRRGRWSRPCKTKSPLRTKLSFSLALCRALPAERDKLPTGQQTPSVDSHVTYATKRTRPAGHPTAQSPIGGRPTTQERPPGGGLMTRERPSRRAARTRNGQAGGRPGTRNGQAADRPRHETASPRVVPRHETAKPQTARDTKRPDRGWSRATKQPSRRPAYGQKRGRPAAGHSRSGPSARSRIAPAVHARPPPRRPGCRSR